MTVALTAYQAERFIGETLESILAQTRPPDEILVVNDGSTDGTARVLERFGDRIRVIEQPNAGCAAGFNTAFRAARCDYVAECGADDLWEPRKLERQLAALAEHPEVDVIFSAARVFGARQGCWGMPNTDELSAGVLPHAMLAPIMYRSNPVCPSTTLTRRSLYERLGPFIERDRIATEDYEYWMRALDAKAVFYYDPEMLVRYRRHDSNASSNHLAMREADLFVHERYAALAGSRTLMRRTLADDHFVLGRLLRDQRRLREARRSFLRSLRLRPSLRCLAWLPVVSLPPRQHDLFSERIISLRRSVPRVLRPQ